MQGNQEQTSKEIIPVNLLSAKVGKKPQVLWKVGNVTEGLAATIYIRAEMKITWTSPGTVQTILEHQKTAAKTFRHFGANTSKVSAKLLKKVNSEITVVAHRNSGGLKVNLNADRPTLQQSRIRCKVRKKLQ